MRGEISHSGEEKSGDSPDIHQVRFQVSDLSGFLKDLRLIGKKYDCSLICFNRQVMAGRKHVLSAILHAERAFASGEPIARSIEVESLLYAAGTRQTGLIGPFGVHEGWNECFLCIMPARAEVFNILSDTVEDAGNDDWETIDPEKERRLCELFGITDAELAICGRDRIPDLVLERVALLVVNR